MEKSSALDSSRPDDWQDDTPQPLGVKCILHVPDTRHTHKKVTGLSNELLTTDRIYRLAGWTADLED